MNLVDGIMEIVLEQQDVEALLREALVSRGTRVPDRLEMRIRTNHKKGTIRVVFAETLEDGDDGKTPGP